MYKSKYLPVEGEIKDGDKIQVNWENGDVTIEEVGINGRGNPTVHFIKTGWAYDKLSQKVKLFLISDDIQVGDEVRVCQTKDNYKNGDYNITGGKVKGLDRNQINVIWSTGINMTGEIPFPHNYVIKVIGEIITPGIKEGQTFERNDFECVWMNRLGQTSLSIDMVQYIDEEHNDDGDPVLVVKIK